LAQGLLQLVIAPREDDIFELSLKAALFHKDAIFTVQTT